MPTLGFHVPENSELLKKIETKAKAHHDGKTSAYVRVTVERDIEGSLSIENERPIRELARVYQPTLMTALAEKVEGMDQGRIIMRMLDALYEARQRKDFDPTAEFSFYNSKDLVVTALQSSPEAMLKVLYGATKDLLAAEGQAPYNKDAPAKIAKDLLKEQGKANRVPKK